MSSERSMGAAGGRRIGRIVARLLSAMGLTALALAALPTPAWGMAGQDCVVSIIESGPLDLDPDTLGSFQVQVSDGPDTDFCSAAQFTLTLVNDTTPGGAIIYDGGVNPIVNPLGGVVSTPQSFFVGMPNVNGPGSATVRATCISGCSVSPSPPDDLVANLAEYTLDFGAALPGGTAAGTINTDIGLPTVLRRNGVAVSGATIRYDLTSGTGGGLGMTGSESFVNVGTDMSGAASANFRASQEGPFTVRASITDCGLPFPPSPNAVAGSKGTCTEFTFASFSITIAVNRTLTIESGDGAAGQAGEAATLVVEALDDGGAASTSITWSILEGGDPGSERVSLGTPGPGISPGFYQLPITFGANTGRIRIEARRLEAGVPPVVFTLENFAYALERLNPAGGSNGGPINSDIGYQVRLNRVGINTTPVAGNTINWTQSGPGSGTFRLQGGGAPSTSSVTDGAGVAAIDFTTPTEGVYSIFASSTAPAAAGPVSFTTSVLAPQLVSSAQPAGPNYTDESIGGVTVLATDRLDGANSFPASGVPVTFTITGGPATFSGGGSSAGPVNTDTAGLASSPAILIGRGAGPVQIQASAPNRPTVNFSLPVTASTYSLDSAASNFSILTDDPINLPVTLLRQGSSTPTGLAGANITWQISPVNGASLGSPTTTTGSTGDAPNTFSAATPGSYTVTAQFDPGLGAMSVVSRAFSINVAPRTRDIVIVDGDQQSAAAGSDYPRQLVVQTRENGQAAGNIPLTVSVNLPSDISVSPTSGNSDTTGNFAISASLASTAAFDRPLQVTVARADDPSVRAVFQLQVDPPPAPSRRELVKGDPSGDQQTGSPGQMLALPLRVVALDDGNGVANQAVRWQASEGLSLMLPDGSQRGPDVTGTSGAFGIATVNVFLPEAPVDNSRGEFMVTASRPGTSASTAFVVRLAGGGAEGLSLRIVSGDEQVGLPGQTLQNDFVVAVTRGDVPASGVAITFAASPEDGRLSVTQATTDAQGRAATRLTFGAASAYQVSATLDASRSVTFNARGPSNQLLIRNGNRQSGVLGTRLDSPLEVELRTSAGAPVAQAPIQWQVENNGDATLGGSGSRIAVSVTNADGVATMSVELGTTGANANLRISAGAQGVPQPVFFTAASRPPGVGPLGGNGQSGPINTLLPQPISLQITEGATGKSLLGVPVRWSIGDGGGSLAEASTTTDAQGRTSNAWTLGALVGTQSVVATLPGGVQVQFTATGTADVAQSRLIRVSGDAQTLVTGTASAPLVVEVRDSANAAQGNVPIIWSILDAAGRPSTIAGFQDNVTRTVTGAGGQTRNTVVFTSPGSVVVRARFDRAAADTESVSFQLQAGISPIPSLSPVARDIGEAFDEFCDEVIAASGQDPGGRDLADVCTVLNDNANTNPGGVGEALEQLENDIAPTLGSSGIDAVNTQFDNLDLRLQMVRGEQFGGRQNQFNIGLWTPDGVLPLSFLPSVVAAAGEDEGEPETGADFGRWGFFATGQIGSGEAEPGQRSPGFDYDIAGLTVGADYRFSDRLVGGLALGYSQNDAEVNGGGGTLDTKGTNLAAYLTWYNEKAWFADATLVYGQIDYDLNRRIFFSLANRGGGTTTIDQIARASTDGDALGASLSVGRDWQKGPWSLSGYAKGNYSRVDTDAYTESLIAGRAGEGLGLTIDGRSTTSMTSILGGRATYIMSRDWGILMPTATLEWEHEFEDDPNRVVARFAFDPTNTRIVREGDDIDSNYLNVGLGVSALFPGGRSAYLYYEELLGASRLSQGLLSLGVRFEF